MDYIKVSDIPYKQNLYQEIHDKLIAKGFTLEDLICRKNKTIPSLVVYSKICYYTCTYNTNTGVLQLRSYIGNNCKRGKCTTHKTIVSLLDYINNLENRHLLDTKYNKPSKERLVVQGKLLKDYLNQGYSLSKSCRLVNLDYEFGKMLIQEGFIDNE